VDGLCYVTLSLEASLKCLLYIQTLRYAMEVSQVEGLLVL